MELPLSGGFLKWGYPQILYFKAVFQYKNRPLLGTPINGDPHLGSLSTSTSLRIFAIETIGTRFICTTKLALAALVT